MDAPTIAVEHLTKEYGDFTAIRDLNFTVASGEILGFLGPNGAGKTTSMRILAGYLPATSGTARIAGYDVSEQSMDVRQRIGYLPETPPLYIDMTVESYLNFVAEIKGVSAGDRPQSVDRAIDRCNLAEKRHSLIRKLSKGFKQRVGIAQALVHDPPVIILDEPTAGLDPKQIIDVRNLIKSLAGEHTIILSTHILPEVSMTCDRVAIIDRGRVVATGTPTELTEQLQEQQQLHLTVAGDRDTLTATLAAFPELQIASLDAIPAADNRWSLTLQHPPAGDRWIARVAAALVGANLELYEMRQSQASLEDIFLHLTTQEPTADPISVPTAA
ncbi:ABC transporter ATP-binding protein [Synechococcus sp. PCC 7336]|uniref:ABC transporter ATP-binding protein n=1 Tax=Synechococcus sp. PCC 7336 TaxID=195250 RepID=UPI000347D3CA|nr:ABC transporter ATP-binding protein [Synechococcus sp. PCC 7336]